ncbi:MAG: hypothetical protein GY820_25620 [Gammaproteobacteria bacterium]|nr:hypothetical protein [Gammaproteobacteria bacterium]
MFSDTRPGWSTAAERRRHQTPPPGNLTTPNAADTPRRILECGVYFLIPNVYLISTLYYNFAE